MPRNSKRNRMIVFIIAIVAVFLCGAALLSYTYLTSKPPVADSEQVVTSKTEVAQEPATQPTEAYKGESTLIADSFSVKVPNGWTASVSNNAGFLAIMFARPNQLTSLVYSPDAQPIIDQQGIPAWSGLTEHFFIIAPTPSRQFDPNDHQEVSSEPFIFDDGFTGAKYYVVKHASEAQKWGGLQKDTEWQGRTYIYEKDGKHIEAHLALYPSTDIAIDFYEDVVRTVRPASK